LEKDVESVILMIKATKDKLLATVRLSLKTVE
jgi:hypothetical protein